MEATIFSMTLFNFVGLSSLFPRLVHFAHQMIQIATFCILVTYKGWSICFDAKLNYSTRIEYNQLLMKL